MDPLTLMGNLLTALLQPDTETIRRATAEINEILKHPASIETLFSLLVQPCDNGVKQYCCVLARMKIAGHWENLSPATQQKIKETLLQYISADEQSVARTVRRQVTSLLAVVIRILLPKGEWTEVLNTFLEATKSPITVHREYSIMLFQQLLESGELLEPLLKYAPTFHNIILAGLNDSEPVVRNAAVQAAHAYSNFFELEEAEQNIEMWKSFGEIVKPMLDHMNFCLTSQKEDEVSPVFSIIDFIVQNKIELLVPFLGELIKYMLDVAKNPDFEKMTRNSALFFIENLIRIRPKTLVELNMLLPLLDTTFKMCSEVDEDDEDDDDDDEQSITAHTCAAQIFSVLSMTIPEKYVWEPFMQRVRFLAQSSFSGDRMSAITALGVVVQGLLAKIYDELPELLPMILRSTSDPAREVREAAYFALGEFCKFLEDDVKNSRDQIVEAVHRGLSDPDKRVMLMSCYTIQTLCEGLKEEMLPHLPQILVRLDQLLPNATIRTQDQIFSCLSTCAMAAKQEFKPFIDPIMGTIFNLLLITDDKTLQLRCRATECCGLFAQAVGSDIFRPYYDRVIDFVLKGLELNDHTLREYSYNCFSNLAEIFGDEVAPCLPVLVKTMIESCKSMEGVTVVGDDHLPTDIEGDEDTSLTPLKIQFVSSYMDEKVAACSGLGTLAKALGSTFDQYFPDALACVEELSAYLDTEVRAASVEALADFSYFLLSSDESYSWEKGEIVDIGANHESHIAASIEAIVDILVSKLADEDRRVVDTALDSLATVARNLGPSALAPHLEDTVHFLTLALQKQAPFQITSETFEDGDADHEFLTFGSISDLLAGLGESFGTVFLKHYPPIHELLVKHLQPTYNADIIALSVGAIAFIVRETGTEFRPFIGNLINVVAGFVNAHEGVLKQNAVFALGFLARYAPVEQKQLILDSANLLVQVVTREGEQENVIDNALGSLANIVSGHRKIVPSNDIINLILQRLPLKEDFEPANYVFDCFLKLISSGDKFITQKLPEVIRHFAIDLLRNDDLIDSVKTEIADTLNTLLTKYPQDTKNVIDSLGFSAEENAELERIIKESQQQDNADGFDDEEYDHDE